MSESNMQARTNFLNALYFFVTDHKNDEKRIRAIECAEKLGGQTLRKQVEDIMPLLVQGHQFAWISLLAWIGNQRHFFDPFKGQSPFANKIIAVIREGMICEDVLPLAHVEKLWDEVEPAGFLRLILVYPPGSKPSLFALQGS